MLLQQAAAMGKYTACASQCKILPKFGRICTVCASLLAADGRIIQIRRTAQAPCIVYALACTNDFGNFRLLFKSIFTAYLDGSGIELGFSVFRKSTHIYRLLQIQCILYLVTLHLVTTSDLVAILQKTITISDNLFGDQKDTTLRVHCT